MTRSRHAVRIAVAAAGAMLTAACSLPVTIPLGPMNGEPELITGSIDIPEETVEEQGIADRVGTQAWAALRGALVSAAERGEDGQAFSWKTDNAGVEGTVTTVDAFFDADGAVCRRLAITAVAYARADSFVADACRRDGGGWNVKPSEQTRR
ncbi:RT0821/Lpp0805 family surface protein [Microbaculum marinum]|uniref:RT0821/Lpp0805 family surface protein n=1 Tax=Microbaculum marinum TaxID=1764581 RepID=A0AAW9RVT8_9HYPH